MDFLAMIGVGVLGLVACGRLFGLLFKLLGLGFDSLENAVTGGRKRRYYDD